MTKKIKIILVISSILALILTAFIGFYFYKKSQKETVDLTDLKEDIQVLKEEVKAEIEESKKTEASQMKIEHSQIVIKDEFSQTLLLLMEIQKKLQFGGEINNDLEKLKNLSVKFSKINSELNDLKEINKIISRDEIFNQFNDYVKIVKSKEISSRGGFLNSFLGFCAKYFAILDSKNPEDAKLLSIEKEVKLGNFEKAFSILKEMKVLESDFATNLEISAKIENLINLVQSEISSKI
jgi:hypothetical protein